MKHKIKKIVNSTLACLMALSMFQVNWNVRAEAIKHNVTEEFPDADWELHGPVSGIGALLKVDGEVSFCLQAKIPVSTGTNEEIPPSVLGLSKETMAELALVVWYGYRSQPSLTNYFLTQNLIWQYLGQGDSYVTNENLYPNKASMQPWFDNILNKVSHFHDTPSFDGQTYTVNMNDTLTIQDTNGVLNGLIIEDVSGAAVSKNGNTLYVTPNNDSADTLTIRFNRGMSLAQTQTNFVVRDKAYQGTSQAVSPCTSGQDPYRSYVNIKIQKHGNLKIAKQNEKGEMVPNTTFKLSYQADMSSPIGTYTTGDDGTVTIQELEPKTVYIQELSVPHPLEVDTSVHSVTIKPNETVTYTQTNQYKRGNLKLAKVDEDGTYIPNTQFKLSYHNDMSDPIGIYTTGSDGTVTVEDLIADTVYIQEISVPAPLILDDSVKSKVIGHNTTITYTARNLYKKGDVEITKKDANSGKVVKKSGVEFDIFKKDGSANGTYIATIATNSQGVALYKNLRYGDYYFVGARRFLISA